MKPLLSTCEVQEVLSKMKSQNIDLLSPAFNENKTGGLSLNAHHVQ